MRNELTQSNVKQQCTSIRLYEDNFLLRGRGSKNIALTIPDHLACDRVQWTKRWFIFHPKYHTSSSIVSNPKCLSSSTYGYLSLEVLIVSVALRSGLFGASVNEFIFISQGKRFESRRVRPAGSGVGSGEWGLVELWRATSMLAWIRTSFGT